MITPAEIAVAHEKLLLALLFYAEPTTYHACAFWFDPPTGGFEEDFDDEHGDSFYDRPMPGKRAREALHEWHRVLGLLGQVDE